MAGRCQLIDDHLHVGSTKRREELFDAPTQPTVFARGDTPGQLLLALDCTPEQDASLRAEYQRRKEAVREMKANGFAAELLAPFQEVRRLASEHPDRAHDDYVELLRQYFNLSRKAARVRLAELLDEPHPDQEILQFVG